MLQDKYILASKLERKLYDIGRTNKSLTNFSKLMKTKYNLSEDIVFDIVSGGKSLADYNDLVCFWITNEVDSSIIPEFFTPKEIKSFPGLQFEEDDGVLPIKLPMYQVAIDQWIGIIRISKLMELRDRGLLRYNADTQRALKVMEKGGEYIYQPYVNKAAVSQIYDRVKQSLFIPNTITLNIPMEDIESGEADYNWEKGEMEITKIHKFDIVDGYHRLLGFERMYDADNEFDMVIELRIIAFSVEKAKQFIWQEDHKTKMKRSDSLSYDTKNECNILLESINTSPDIPELQNKINNKEGLIRIGSASKVLNKVFGKGKWSSAQMNRNRSLVIKRIRRAIDDNPELAIKRWSEDQIKEIFGSVVPAPTENGGE